MASSFLYQDGQYKGSKHAIHYILCMSTLVLVAFTQPCIQSNGAHVKGVESVICIQGSLTPPGGKAHCSCQCCGFSGSPV